MFFKFFCILFEYFQAIHLPSSHSVPFPLFTSGKILNATGSNPPDSVTQPIQEDVVSYQQFIFPCHHDGKEKYYSFSFANSQVRERRRGRCHFPKLDWLPKRKKEKHPKCLTEENSQGDRR